MPCYHPIPAWRTNGGEVRLHRELPDSEFLRLPCGTCIGCRTSKARAWALRCHLENQQHDKAVFTTLTYDDTHLPPTLHKPDLQGWLKRLRRQTTTPIRFFASGEYGEQNKRPHYHAIIYGLGIEAHERIETTWAKGFTRTYPATASSISYVAGYTAKKIEHNDFQYRNHTRGQLLINPHTGEVYRFQPEFLQMSRGGRNGQGIGGHARKWANSWRKTAIHNGYIMPVPRYLHEAWQKTATPIEQEDLIYEKIQEALKRDTSKPRLQAAEAMAIAKQKERSKARRV